MAIACGKMGQSKLEMTHILPACGSWCWGREYPRSTMPPTNQEMNPCPSLYLAAHWIGGSLCLELGDWDDTIFPAWKTTAKKTTSASFYSAPGGPLLQCTELL